MEKLAMYKAKLPDAYANTDSFILSRLDISSVGGIKRSRT